MPRRRGDAILMGEVNLPPDQQRAFFGDEDGDELHMVLSFVINQAMYLSLARGDATPLRDALAALPQIPEDCQWANFVRNHDELTLDKLSEEERAEVFAAFGPEEDLQLYGRGLRRRLPTMVGGDERRIRMLYSLAFALPGTPVLFYGEEIGMGEDLDAEGRLAVRTPMQWTPHGGFSSADPADWPGPMPDDGYGPEHVNVSAQRRDPDSLLSWIRLLVERYRECPELAWGEYQVLDTGEDAVLAHRCDIDGGTVIAVHNLADHVVKPVLELPEKAGCRLTDLLVDGACDVPRDGRVPLELPAYGTRWLRATAPEEAEATPAGSSG
ncbi:MAG TPA: hypothetical protein VGD67_27855 [Pseudonocardiaceae bacterium]